jgi:hypothetical protein
VLKRNVRTGNGGSGFPGAWARPSPVERDFTGSSGVTCTASGSSRSPGTLDTVTNPRKNRVDGADPAHVLSVATIIALPEDPLAPHNRTKWSDAEKAAIAGYEGVAVSATGFLATVDNAGHRARHEGAESCNCDLIGADEVDWHLYLTPSPAAPKRMAVVVELTPRVRKDHASWTDGAIEAASVSMRVTGWLMYDPDHPDQVGTSRGTVWEIHPVTKLEKWNGSGWTVLGE